MTVGDDRTTHTLSLPPPRYLRWEIFAVFAVSLGASGLNALLDLVNALLANQSLSSQQALLVGSLSRQPVASTWCCSSSASPRR